MPACAVEAKDTTGAGDAFHAGYAFARGSGADLVEAMDFASAVAALKCRDWGGRRGLPDLAAARHFQRSAPRRPTADLERIVGDGSDAAG